MNVGGPPYPRAMNPFRLSTRIVAAPRASRAPGVVWSPAETAADAVEVPWRVTRRSDSGVIEVEHRGSSPLHSVRFSMAGQGMLGLSLPRTVLPGERVRVVVRGREADRVRGFSDAMLVLRWFQPDGTELLWPIAL